MKYIIGNWKANKKLSDAEAWIKQFLSYDFSKVKHNVQIIICPPYPFIPFLKEKTVNSPFIKIGSQDVSIYYEGPYTGEVTARSLTGIVDYAIVGHSERRQNFNESDDMLFSKVDHLAMQNIKPIYCIRGKDDAIAPKTNIVAYEPVFAIGTGQSDTIENIVKVKQSLNLSSQTIFIYGGSVTDDNAALYLRNNDIDGVLPGSASLDPKRFYGIVSVCA